MMNIVHTKDLLGRVTLIATYDDKYFCKCISKKKLKQSQVDFICNQIVDLNGFNPRFFYILNVNGFVKYQLGVRD